MANTKIPVELSSTPGIVDNSDATAITITSDENVRIGANTTDTGVLEVAGSKSVSSGIPLNQFTVTDTAAYAAGVGGALLFLGRYNSGGAFTSLASVEASKENATSGEYGSSLVFKTRTHGGSNNERGRFLSSGGLTFNGDTAAANALDDYEQGTWTPTLPNGGTINTNYSSKYTKIGNVVHYYTYLLLSFVNNSSEFRITLPYDTSSVTSSTYVQGTVGYSGTVITDDMRSHVMPNSNPAYVYFHETDGTAAPVTNANLYARNYSDGRVTAFIVSGWYCTEDQR